MMEESSIGKRVWTTDNVLRRGSIVRVSHFCAFVADSEGIERVVVESQIHYSIEKAIAACESESEYWQDKIKELEEERAKASMQDALASGRTEPAPVNPHDDYVARMEHRADLNKE